MIIKIITPNKIIFSEETDLFIIPALEGDIGVLDYHSPLITALRPGIVYIYQKKSIAKTFFLNDGIFEFSNNKGILLTESAEETDKIDFEKLKKKISDLEKKEDSLNLKLEKDKYDLGGKKYYNQL